MANQKSVNGIVVPGGTATKNQLPLRLVLLNEDGTPKVVANPAAAQANSTATDVAGLVTDFNALLAKLRTAGVLKTS